MLTLADIALSALLVLEVLLATLVFCHGTTRTLTARSCLGAAAALVGSAAFQASLYEPLARLGLPLSALPWVVLFLANVAAVFLVRDVSGLEALVLSSLGYCLHHIASDVVLLLSLATPTFIMPLGAMSLPARYPLLAAVFLLCYTLVGRRFSVDVVLTRGRPRWIAFSMGSLVVTIVLGLALIADQPPEAQVACYGYDILCSILILALMVSVSRSDRLANSLSSIELLWEQKRAQYELSRENIELINIKCHDIRNRISQAGSAGAPLSSDAIHEMIDSIRIYDSSVRTGNTALDTVLTEKRLICSEENIELSCMADGSLLSGVSDDDLYFLMDNILRNAIEATRELSDAERRVISLTVTAAGPMVRILEENYFDGELEFADGLPRSTKGDDDNHGFGMRSIRHMVDKYKGDLALSVRDGVFSLSILLPKP